MHKIPQFLQKIIDHYSFEILDEVTVKHINGHAQIVSPGPYKIYIGENSQLCVSFHFATPEEYTWWMLKWD